jgi:hypothetical protein
MTVTISYTAFLLTILTGVAVAALVYLIVVLARLNRTAARIEGLVGKTDELLASLKTLADESTHTVVVARGLLEEGHLVVADVAAASAHVRELAAGGAGQALTLFGRVKSILAIAAGVKTAIATVRNLMGRRRHAAEGETEN